MNAERALHEFVLLGCRMRALLQEEIFERQDDRPPRGYSRQAAVVHELDRLLEVADPLKPTIEQLRQWESERLAERKAKE